MATQSDRRIATRTAILQAARSLFGEHGFGATTIDQIGAAAGVAKGAVYHHFPTKEAVFEAVFDQVSKDLAELVAAASSTKHDVLAALTAGTKSYFAACSEGPTAQIILKDGPAVLGWERWRQIDEQHFGGMIPRALGKAMKEGLIARQPIEPLARLLLGAITEAAAACSVRADVRKAGNEYGDALVSLLEALRSG
ncbi:TetR/AcrR family transcriptional regulator [Bradyrhizobium sp. RDT10]